MGTENFQYDAKQIFQLVAKANADTTVELNKKQGNTKKANNEMCEMIEKF